MVLGLGGAGLWITVESLDIVVHGESQNGYTLPGNLKIKPWCAVICMDREMASQKHPDNGYHLL